MIPRMPVVVLLAAWICVPPVEAQWEPFIAKVRRTYRTVYADGRTTVYISEHTFLRSSTGSLRHEVRRVSGDQALEPPTSITLHDVNSRQTYYLDVQRKVVSVAPGFNDPRQTYVTTPPGPGAKLEEFHGVRCAPVRSFFYENGKLIAGGKACRAEGYGISIYERAEIPDRTNNATMYWEADLIEFRANTEPEARLMRAPEDYQVVQLAARPGPSPAGP